MDRVVVYIVRQPGALLKTWETARPISFHCIEVASSSWFLFGPLCSPKSLIRLLTKSEGVMPSLQYSLTDVTKVFAMSNRASASATCSLGFVTEKKKGRENTSIQVKTSIHTQNNLIYFSTNKVSTYWKRNNLISW